MTTNKAVFLSYASQDADAAQRICHALRAAGVEVWFDRNELVGGDAWDQKIRRQIKECALFVPMISAHTEARAEGYFRREWKLAVERTNDMADHVAFIVPIVIDETREADAFVPDKFRAVQWTRIAAGEAGAAFCGRVKALLDGAGGRGSAGPLGAPAAANKEMPAVARGAAAADRAAPKSIAVLAFANMSHDPENEYFSDGITEELLNVLAKVPGLRVTARTSAFFFKGKNVPVPEIAQQLGVAYLVEGSVRRAGNRVRITAQLIDARADCHLWSETFDRELKDIFSVQDEIAGLIGQNLQLKIGSTGPRASRIVNPEAYRLCLQGRREAASLSEQGMLRAMTLYTRALEIDPGFAEARADIAQLDVQRFALGLFPKSATATLIEAESNAREALRLAPDIGEPHIVLADIALVRGELGEAEAELARALEICADCEHLLMTYPFFLLRIGRPDRMAEEAERLGRANPLSWAAADLTGVGRLYGGRPAEAVAHHERAVTLGSAPVSHAHHALALARLGKYDEAIRRARVAMDPVIRHGWSAGFLMHSDAHAAWALAESGASEEAEAAVRAILSGPEHCRTGAGLALAVLGRLDEAFTWLPATPQKFVGFMLNLVHHCEPLRNDPRCEPLLRQLGALDAFETMGRVLRREPVGDSQSGIPISK